MLIIRSLLLAAILLVACVGGCAKTSDADPAAEVAKATLTKIGDTAPSFSAELVGGGSFDLEAQRGRVVLLNWFATWCPPCRAEMPHLQTEVWERFGSRDDFAMVSISREETDAIVRPFVVEFETTWPFAVDPDRSRYALYASGYIPRNYVIDREGKIVFQSQGFEAAEFAEMIEVIAKLLDDGAH